MSILRWLGLSTEEAPDGDSEVVRRIVSELESLDRETARRLALFAFLLARVANVDLDVDAAETAAMERLVREHGRLAPAQAALVVQIAKAENRLLGPTHNFLAARELRDAETDARKLALLECLFAVAAADGSISVAEEEEIRVISRTLLLPDADYLVVRSRFSDRRSVLQGWPSRRPSGGAA
ncbi:MAG TPA: TerB family tellurite resistance protein [Anaeromyxobacteraceae bacterium]|jgi:uncharacterized tellurite resistance protein B-like protein